MLQTQRKNSLDRSGRSAFVVSLIRRQIKDKNLTIDDLASLGSRIPLPDGWTFATRALSEDYDLVTTRLAYVINDDFYNSYQRRT